MPKWTEKTEVVTLSADDKVLCEQSDTNKTCTMQLISDFVEGTITERVFGYMTTSVNTVMTDANSWYALQGIYDNSIIEGFGLGTTGIEYLGFGSFFEAEFMTGGNANKTAIIKIGLVKNGVFDAVTHKLTTGAMLEGSGGLTEVTTLSSASGFGNPRGLWAGELETNDEITIMIQSSVGATTWTPIGGNASIHRFI